MRADPDVGSKLEGSTVEPWWGSRARRPPAPHLAYPSSPSWARVAAVQAVVVIQGPSLPAEVATGGAEEVRGAWPPGPRRPGHLQAQLTGPGRRPPGRPRSTGNETAGRGETGGPRGAGQEGQLVDVGGIAGVVQVEQRLGLASRVIGTDSCFPASVATVAATAAVAATGAGRGPRNGFAASSAAPGSGTARGWVGSGRTTATRSFSVVAGASVKTRCVANPPRAWPLVVLTSWTLTGYTRDGRRRHWPPGSG